MARFSFSTFRMDLCQTRLRFSAQLAPSASYDWECTFLAFRAWNLTLPMLTDGLLVDPITIFVSPQHTQMADDSSRQISQMIQFILQEAHEKAEEIRQKTNAEYEIQFQDMKRQVEYVCSSSLWFRRTHLLFSSGDRC